MSTKITLDSLYNDSLYNETDSLNKFIDRLNELNIDINSSNELTYLIENSLNELTDSELSKFVNIYTNIDEPLKNAFNEFSDNKTIFKLNAYESLAELDNMMMDVNDYIKTNSLINFTHANFMDNLWKNEINSSITIPDYLKGEIFLDPDIIMLQGITIKLAKAITNGLIHIVKKAIRKMIASDNIFHLVLYAKINAIEIINAAKGVQIKCIAELIKSVNYIIKKIIKTKTKLKLLIDETSNSNPTEQLLSETEQNLYSSLKLVKDTFNMKLFELSGMILNMNFPIIQITKKMVNEKSIIEQYKINENLLGNSLINCFNTENSFNDINSYNYNALVNTSKYNKSNNILLNFAPDAIKENAASFIISDNVIALNEFEELNKEKEICKKYDDDSKSYIALNEQQNFFNEDSIKIQERIDILKQNISNIKDIYSNALSSIYNNADFQISNNLSSFSKNYHTMISGIQRMTDEFAEILDVCFYESKGGAVAEEKIKSNIEKEEIEEKLNDDDDEYLSVSDHDISKLIVQCYNIGIDEAILSSLNYYSLESDSIISSFNTVNAFLSSSLSSDLTSSTYIFSDTLNKLNESASTTLNSLIEFTNNIKSLKNMDKLSVLDTSIMFKSLKDINNENDLYKLSGDIVNLSSIMADMAGISVDSIDELAKVIIKSILSIYTLDEKEDDKSEAERMADKSEMIRGKAYVEGITAISSIKKYFKKSMRKLRKKYSCQIKLLNDFLDNTLITYSYMFESTSPDNLTNKIFELCFPEETPSDDLLNTTNIYNIKSYLNIFNYASFDKTMENSLLLCFPEAAVMNYILNSSNATKYLNSILAKLTFDVTYLCFPYIQYLPLELNSIYKNLPSKLSKAIQNLSNKIVSFEIPFILNQIPLACESISSAESTATEYEVSDLLPTIGEQLITKLDFVTKDMIPPTVIIVEKKE